MNPRIAPTAVGVLLLLGVLTACSGPSVAAPSPSPVATTAAPEVSAEPTTTPEPDAEPAALTCEAMISPGTVTALTDAGWTAEAKDFVIGDITISADRGLLCFWADYAVASDHGQLYGWAAMAAAEATEAQTALLSSGWRREDSDAGIVLTEDPQYSMGTDDDGYGMTYLFGDGWVKFSDTKQGLLLIDWAG